MKKLLKQIGTVVLLMSVGGLGALHAAGVDVGTLKLLKTAMSSRVVVQIVAKDYLYAGNEVAVTKAKKEMAAALKAFDAKQKKLANSINDPKTKNLMVFIDMNLEELKDTVTKPYSLDNAAVVIDLAEAISEGELKIADQIREKAKYKGVVAKGQRYDIEQIAKYYMAYQAGLKDDVTVRQMKKTVKHFKGLLQEMKSNNNNNVKMNQIMNRVDKLWKIVHQFYLDIEEGGLPLIVYQTSRKLDDEMIKYSKEVIKVKAARKGK